MVVDLAVGVVYSAAMVIEGRSPFHPTFGSRPHTLAGRDTFLAEVIDDFLNGGPSAKGFTRAFVGDRGIGKTVLLDEIGATVRNGKWEVIHCQPTPSEDPIAAISREASAHLPGLGRKWADVEKSSELGINVGLAMVKVGARTRRQERGRAKDVLSATLKVLGSAAKERGIGVLVTVDEAHAFRGPSGYQEIGSIWQMLVKRESQLPLALILAGLPGLRGRIRSASATFFERLQWDSIGPVDFGASKLALLQPVADAGGAIEPDALDYLADASRGYPYLIQLLGDETWKVGLGKSRITLADARLGRVLAIAEYQSILQDRWKMLSPQAQRYLVATAKLGPGKVSTAEVARAMEKDSTTQTSYLRDALLKEHELLEPSGQGYVRFRLPEFGEWIRGHHEVLPDPPQVRPRGIPRPHGRSGPGLPGDSE